MSRRVEVAPAPLTHKRHIPIGRLTLWLFGCLLALDLVLRLIQPLMLTRLRGPVGWYTATENLLLGPSAPAPVVLLLGSSRIRDGVAPFPLEDQLGLPRGAVLDLGISSGGPMDALAFYSSHRSLLSQAQVTMFSVEDWQFNASNAEADDSRFRERASLRDRLTFPDGPKAWDLALGYGWELWDERSYLRIIAGGLLLGWHPLMTPYHRDELGRATPDASEAEDAGDQASGQSTDTIAADGFLKHYEPFNAQLQALADLSRLVRQDGNQLVLIRMPLRSSYNRVVNANYSAEEAAWHAELAKAVPDSPLQDWKDPAQFGLTDSDFLDYGHLTTAGSIKFTNQFKAVLAPMLKPGPS